MSKEKQTIKNGTQTLSKIQEQEQKVNSIINRLLLDSYSYHKNDMRLVSFLLVCIATIYAFYQDILNVVIRLSK